MKISAILFLMLIGSLFATRQSCLSCGHECAPACGSRRFRLCCFNYLRKKRDPDMTQSLYKDKQEYLEESIQRSKLPILNEFVDQSASYYDRN